MHVGGAKKLYRALVDSGRIHAFFELAQGYFARGIARHLKDMGLKDLVEGELDARSHALAGNLLSLLIMVARSGREKITKGNGINVPPDGVVRTPIQIQIT